MWYRTCWRQQMCLNKRGQCVRLYRKRPVIHHSRDNDDPRDQYNSRKYHFNVLSWSIERPLNEWTTKYIWIRWGNETPCLTLAKVQKLYWINSCLRTSTLKEYIFADSQATQLYRGQRAICTVWDKNRLLSSAESQKYHSMSNPLSNKWCENWIVADCEAT